MVSGTFTPPKTPSPIQLAQAETLGKRISESSKYNQIAHTIQSKRSIQMVAMHNE